MAVMVARNSFSGSGRAQAASSAATASTDATRSVREFMSNINRLVWRAPVRGLPSPSSRCVGSAGGADSAEVRREPAFEFADGFVLACGQVFELVPPDAADIEVLRLRVGQVEAADRGSRVHRVVLC